jgi:hypothetical protein
VNQCFALSQSYIAGWGEMTMEIELGTTANTNTHSISTAQIIFIHFEFAPNPFGANLNSKCMKKQSPVYLRLGQ